MTSIPGFLLGQCVLVWTDRLAPNFDFAGRCLSEADVRRDQRRWDNWRGARRVVRENPIDARRYPFWTVAVPVVLDPLIHPLGTLCHQPWSGADLLRGVGELVHLPGRELATRSTTGRAIRELEHVLVSREDDRVLAVGGRVDGVFREQDDIAPVGGNVGPGRRDRSTEVEVLPTNESPDVAGLHLGKLHLLRLRVAAHQRGQDGEEVLPV